MATWGDTAPRWRRDVMDQMRRMEQQRAAKNAEIRRIEEARRQIAANRASTTPPWVLHPRKIADLLREAVPTMPNRQESALHKDALKAYDHLHDDMLLAMLKQNDKGLEILRQEKREGGYPYKTVNTGMVQRAQEANMGGREYGQRHTAGATMLAGTMVALQSSGWMMPVRGGAMGHGFVIEDVVKGNSVRVAMI